MPVLNRCRSDHTWPGAGPCPACGSEAVTPSASGNTLTDAASASAPAAAPFPHIPGYELHAEIGSGGMGVVYRATQLNLGRPVALKVIRGRELANPHDLKRFVMEAEVVAKLQHPNVVQVYDVGVSDAGPYYTMELLSGANLGETLDQSPLSFRDAARLLATVARAVESAHRHGIVHRDLKPANILMTADGTPKLVDFGVAKKLSSDDGLTETGKPIGTPGYMSPEQAAGKKEVGPGADVYALGVILYKLLAGRVPFEGDTLYDTLHAIINVDPVSPAWYRADVPRDLEAICLKCLGKKPGERYPTAAALADDLDRYLADRRISVGWTPPWVRVGKWCRRHPTLATAITAAFGVLLVAGVFAAVYPWRPAVVPEVKEDPAVALRRDEVERRVASLLRNPPQVDREQPHPVEQQASLDQPPTDGFEVLSDDRVVDLRGWRRVDFADPAPQSFVTFNNRRVMAKLAPADGYPTRYQTSGRGLVVRGLAPNPQQSRVLSSTGVVGGQTLKTAHVVSDVRDVPLNQEFTLHTAATLIDSLQVPDDQWLGLIGFKGSVRSSMLLLFPPDKPFAEFRLRVAPERNAPPVPFADPPITFQAADRTWVYWEVSGPKDGHVYRIDWTW